MRATTTALTLISVSLGAAAAPAPSPYEAIRQAQYLLSDLIDTKQYDRLNEAVTDDFIHDSRPLGDRGSLSEGVEEFANDVREATGDALTQHSDTNTLIRFNNEEGTSANMTSYVTFSQWDPAALYNISRTFRIYERTDNTYVMDSNGKWKMSYSLVTNMAPQAEGIYWNDGNDKCEEVSCPAEPAKGDGYNYDNVDWTKVNYDGVNYLTEPQPAQAEGQNYETKPKADNYETEPKADNYETQPKADHYETQPQADHYETQPKADHYETQPQADHYETQPQADHYETQPQAEQPQDNHSGEYKTEAIPEQPKDNSVTYETEHMH